MIRELLNKVYKAVEYTAQAYEPPDPPWPEVGKRIEMRNFAGEIVGTLEVQQQFSTDKHKRLLTIIFTDGSTIAMISPKPGIYNRFVDAKDAVTATDLAIDNQ